MDTVTQELLEMQKLLDPKLAKRKTLPPFKVDESLYPIEQENQVIDYFRDNWVDNDKKIIRMVRHVYPGTPRFIQKSFLDVILSVADPKKMLLFYFAEKIRWGEIIEKMVAEGNHGVIYDDHSVYGFVVETRDNWLKEDDKWMMSDEQEIIKRSYYAWARGKGLKHFKGKVMMFHHFGFSGMSYFFDHAIDDKEGY